MQAKAVEVLARYKQTVLQLRIHKGKCLYFDIPGSCIRGRFPTFELLALFLKQYFGYKPTNAFDYEGTLVVTLPLTIPEVTTAFQLAAENLYTKRIIN